MAMARDVEAVLALSHGVSGESLDRVNTITASHWLAFYDAIPEVVRAQPCDAIRLLIAALGADEMTVALPAGYLLHHLTGLDFGFQPYGSREARLAAQAAWLRWWEESAATFSPNLAALSRATLIVDEIPGRIVGDDDEPPGRLTLLDEAGEVAWQTERLKMPYDAAPLPGGGYLVNIIRARAVWQLDSAGSVMREYSVGGYPCSLQLLPDGHFLVAGWDDDCPGFVREFDTSGAIVWRHEPLRWPWKAERLANGHTLIADAGMNRVYEVDAQGVEVWAAEGLGPEEPALFDALGPVYCQRLFDGNTLVSIRALSRIVELAPDGRVVWEVGPEIVANQYSAVRLWNGNTLIADAGHFRVIELTVDQRIVWERGGFGYPAKAYRC